MNAVATTSHSTSSTRATSPAPTRTRRRSALARSTQLDRRRRSRRAAPPTPRAAARRWPFVSSTSPGSVGPQRHRSSPSAGVAPDAASSSAYGDAADGGEQVGVGERVEPAGQRQLAGQRRRRPSPSSVTTCAPGASRRTAGRGCSAGSWRRRPTSPGGRARRAARRRRVAVGPVDGPPGGHGVVEAQVVGQAGRLLRRPRRRRPLSR